LFTAKVGQLRKLEKMYLLGAILSKEQAYAWSRTRMGGWAILGTTITVKRLKIRGYISLVEYHKTASLLNR
jgi:RNA-directed DNA polymerase